MSEKAYFTPMFSELLKRRSGDQINTAALCLGELRLHLSTTFEKNPLLVLEEFVDHLEAVATELPPRRPFGPHRLEDFVGGWTWCSGDQNTCGWCARMAKDGAE